MDILKIRDKLTGAWKSIPAIIGPKGDKGDKGDPGEPGLQGQKGSDGKSAFASAVEGGYTGTEQQFNAQLGGIGNAQTKDNLVTTLSGADDTHYPSAKAVKDETDKKAPAYTYGTVDLEAGVSSLETGKLYFVHEE